MKTNQIVTLLFLGVGVLGVIAYVYFEFQDNLRNRNIVKPILPFSFALVFLYHAFAFASVRLYSFILFFVYLTYGLGDIMMETGRQNTFYGMVIFTFGHLAFLFTTIKFKSLIKEPEKNQLLSQNVRRIIGLLVWFGLLGYAFPIIFDVYNHGCGPALFYGAFFYCHLFGIIAFFAMSSYSRTYLAAVVCFSSICYGISDCTVAQQRFINNKWWMHAVVMGGYWAAITGYAISSMFFIWNPQENNASKQEQSTDSKKQKKTHSE